MLSLQYFRVENITVLSRRLIETNVAKNETIQSEIISYIMLQIRTIWNTKGLGGKFQWIQI